MLHRLEIYVSDSVRSKDFWLSWKFGSIYLVFVQAKKKYLDAAYHRCRIGLNDLAFQTHSKVDPDRIKVELVRLYEELK
ncbi:hypothetical protein J6TS2_28210 [Heyndrickxia sporothermodurans]|nr:hypothetical protein J6TS2_28210 [Heyndrickxia sporothermodurans]